MADRLVIKGDDLLEAYNKIVYLHGEFDAATSRSGDAASSVGHPGLKSELENVAGSWRIHRGKILESLADMESQIKGTLDTFGDIDDRMGQNLRGEGGQQAPADPGGGATPPASPLPSRPQPQPGSREPAPAPAQPAPVVEAAPEAVAHRGAPDRETQDSADFSDADLVPGRVDLSDFPPEMRVLLTKLQALTTSPDFIAKYPQFAAGASLGALLPLLLAAGAGHTDGGRWKDGASGPHSARDEVRTLLQGVRKDVADGHLDAMTPSQARAELERLLGGADVGTAESAVAEGDATSDAVPGEETPPGSSGNEQNGPEAEAGKPPRAGTAPGGAGSASAGSGEERDFREGSPMLNEDPNAVGQVTTTTGSGEQSNVSGGTGSVVTDGVPGGSAGSTATSAESFPASQSSAQSPSVSSTAGQAGSTGDAATSNHIPTPMMSAGSMGGGSSAGSSMAGGASSSTPSAATPSSGSSSSATSSRAPAEKTSETRKAEDPDVTRKEGDAR